MPEISIIIIHWNTPDLLKKQLELLKEREKNIEVIVVDNFSEKTARKVLTMLSSKVDHLILNNENLGFAKAGNIGAKLARGTWLLFLNPDVLITPVAIESFLEETKKQNFAASSPKTLDPRYMKPLPTVFSLSVEFSPLHRFIPLNRFKQKTLTGGCLMINKSLFTDLNGWDEDFFLWFEDSDLTKRLIDNGYSVGWVRVDMQHQGGASFEQLDEKQRRKMFFSSMKLYSQKHFTNLGKRMVELLSVRFT